MLVKAAPRICTMRGNSFGEGIASSIKTNQMLTKARTTRELEQIYTRHLSEMNLINLGTFMKKWNQLRFQQSVSEERAKNMLTNVVDQIQARLAEQQKQLIKQPEQHSRVIANIFFYINSIQELDTAKSHLNSQLLLILPYCLPSMNGQELTTTIISLLKIDHPQKTVILDQAVEKVITSIRYLEIRSLTMVLYHLTKEVESTQYTKLFTTAVQYLSDDRSLSKASPQDFCNIVSVICKRKEFKGETQLFGKLERVGILLANKVNFVGLSAIFHSLTLPHQPVFSKQFYVIYEPEITSKLEQINNKAFSVILRGYLHFNYGSEKFRSALALSAIERAPTLDPESFSTVFYHFSKEKSLNTDVVEEMAAVLEGKDLSQFSCQQVQYLIYGFAINNQRYLDLFRVVLMDKTFGTFLFSRLDDFTEKELISVANSMRKLQYDEQKMYKVLKKIDEKVLLRMDYVELSLRSVLDLYLVVLRYFVGYRMAFKHDNAQLMVKRLFELTKRKLSGFQKDDTNSTNYKIISQIVENYQHDIMTNPEIIFKLCDEEFLRELDNMQAELQEDDFEIKNRITEGPNFTQSL